MKFAGDPKYRLKPSKKNPKVRRWMRAQGQGGRFNLLDLTKMVKGLEPVGDILKEVFLREDQVMVLPKEDWERLSKKEGTFFPLGEDGPIFVSPVSGEFRVREDIESWIEENRDKPGVRIPKDEPFEKSLFRLLLYSRLYKNSQMLWKYQPDTRRILRGAKSIAKSAVEFLGNRAHPRFLAAAEAENDLAAAAILGEILLVNPKDFSWLWRFAESKGSKEGAALAMRATDIASTAISNSDFGYLIAQSSVFVGDPYRWIISLLKSKPKPNEPNPKEWGSDDSLERALDSYPNSRGVYGRRSDVSDTSGVALKVMMRKSVPLWRSSFVNDKAMRHFLKKLSEKNREAFNELIKAPIVVVPKHGPLVRALTFSKALVHEETPISRSPGGIFSPYQGKGVILLIEGTTPLKRAGSILVHELTHMWDNLSEGELRRKAVAKEMGLDDLGQLRAEMSEILDKYEDQLSREAKWYLRYGTTADAEVSTTLTEVAFSNPEDAKLVLSKSPRLRQFLEKFWGFDPMEVVNELSAGR